MTAFKDTIPVRTGEELNMDFVEKLIRTHVEGISDEPIEIKQFYMGSSNLTYQIRIGNWEAVLRKPPHGPLPPKAHDMEREYKILRELHPYFPAVPEPYFYYEGDENHKPFFLMERKRGIVLNDCFPEDVNVTEELCWRLSELMVDGLVKLHEIDFTKTNLVHMTNPDGFLERQVHGWIKRYDRSKIDEHEGIDELKNWFIAHMPKSLPATVIHYDFKFNNLMFNKELTEIVGLFDWEMTTVGDPLVDVGVALSYWHNEETAELLKRGLGGTALTTLPGFMSKDEFIEAYAKKSGRDLSNIHYYQTFAYFKLAVLCQQIYYRWKMGQTKDERFATLNIYVDGLISYALKTARQYKNN